MAIDLSLGLQGVNARILMENAERLGRIERSLIGKKYPVKTLTPLPLKAAMLKSLPSDNTTLLSKAVLLRDGCVSIKNVLSTETADDLLKFVNNEKEKCEIEVKNGQAIYDDRFGAVNNRYISFLSKLDPSAVILLVI
jgi:hypothetical protein